MPLVGGPFTAVPSKPNDFIYAVLYVGTATTLPTFARGVNSNSAMINAGAAAGRYRYGSLTIANTATLPATVTPTSMAKASNSYWLGLS